MARLDDLLALREGLFARMGGCESDQNYAVMGRLLADVVKQIDELAPVSADAPATGLSEFERRLRERESVAKTPRSAAAK